MRKALKIVGILLGVVLLLAGGLVGFLALRSPDMRPPSTEKVESTPARVARGRYIAYDLVGCLGCHSDFVPGKFALPIKPGTEGGGGFTFDDRLGVPGEVTAQNLTPDAETGKASWTDGELMRAFREGISKDGHVLFPMMPYKNLRYLSDEDARSVVAFLRTLKPIRRVIPPTRIRFPVNLLIKGVPHPSAGPAETPKDEVDHDGYGRYLVTVAGCQDCHTPHDDQQQPIPGKEFSGGWEMTMPGVRVRTANITPHPDTFVGQASKEQFIARFKAFQGLDDPARTPEAAPGMNTFMPWIYYANLTEKDLGAIYDYLRKQPPIKNDVVRFPDAPAQPAAGNSGEKLPPPAAAAPPDGGLPARDAK